MASPTIGQIRGRLRVVPAGRITQVSQRKLEPPPYLNCRFYQFVVLLIYSGVTMDRANMKHLAERLRVASGRPEVFKGKLQGSSASDLDRALSRVLPWIRVRHLRIQPDDLLRDLGNRYIAGVGVRLDLLPARLQQWSGGNRIGHQISLTDGFPKARAVDYLDPLGPWDWRPVRVGLEEIQAAITEVIKPTGWPPYCTIMEKGDGVQDTIVPGPVYAPGSATAPIKARKYRVYDADLEGFREVKPKTVKTAHTAEVAYQVRVARRPARQPQGRFVAIASGPLDGLFVHVDDVEVTVAPPTGGVPEAELKAAFRRGQADMLSQFEAVDIDGPLFRREEP